MAHNKAGRRARRLGRAAPSSQRGWKTELVLLEPRQPCGGSHRQPINLSHVGSSAAPYDKHSASCCSPLVSSAVFYSLKGGEQRILNEPIPPFVELWSDVLIKATQTEARKDSNSKYCTCSSWGEGGGTPRIDIFSGCSRSARMNRELMLSRPDSHVSSHEDRISTCCGYMM